MTRQLRTLGLLPIVLIVAACFVGGLGAAEYRVTETIELDKVPSWFPVGFCLLTHGDRQYVAYYNEHHQMIVAQRKLGSRQWQTMELPTKVGWDSHNYITMAVSRDGLLHLAGNMHCVPLIYFQSHEPGDITTLRRRPMNGWEEQRCTYPRFLTTADGELLFMYRSGGSGNGRRLLTRFSIDTWCWTDFLETPLFDGEGKRNAYPIGPTKGPDGLFHVVWVWRDTPDCATNHHLSYARSRDLESWETAGGIPVKLPLTLDQSELCVDPIPPGGGIINGCEKLAFDSDNRPVIAYHKLDDKGHMQIFVARFQQAQWCRHPITTWEKNISFGGGGAMPFIGIKISSLQRLPPDMLFINYRHRDYGSGRIVLREDTLQPVHRDVTIPRPYPRALSKPTIAFEGISVRMAYDLGTPKDPNTKYLLRWETLGPNHDRPRKPPLPPASTLTLVKLETEP
jgi:hypothetical protein